MKCVASSKYQEVDITDMYLEWVYLHGICHWQKKYENVKKNAAEPTVIAEYIYGLLSVIRRKKYRNYGEYLHRYPNLLNRDFNAERPNQKWVTDISYIHTNQGVLYLSIIRDLYDNSIVAYKTGTEQNVNLVLSTIKAAKRKEKVTAELQLHSDQGFQYTSQAYHRLIQSYGITPSMSRRGNPYDNALAENFFSILKTECIYRAKLQTYEEANLLIDEYIHFYNNLRIQLKSKLTPLEKRSQFVA